MFRTLDVVAASTRRRETGKSSRDVHVGDFARYDGGRALRTGAPEVILGEGKDPEHLLALLTGLHERGYGAIVSRVTSQQRRALERSSSGLPLVFLAGGRVVRLGGPILGPSYAGTVAILTAGTADVPVAEEARAVLESVGVTVATGYDVGVAGIHRLMKILRKLARQRPRIFLVFAGREGALPTVVAGLVAGPVIGIPTSVGYGRGARGEGALTAMLQSCAPIAIVNIDGAVPAALLALRLLSNRASHTPPRRRVKSRSRSTPKG
ncbi:MAG: nickel pincer cofactor biosynthesis protein LarB [Thermoplasmata archaeon]